MFVLRDFDEKSNNEEVIKNILEDDILKIWRDIYKPEQYLENTQATDFFDFNFQFMPHKFFEEKNFYEACNNLK